VNYIVVHYWLERVGYYNSFWRQWVTNCRRNALNWKCGIGVLYAAIYITGGFRTALFLAVIAYAWDMLSLHSQRKLSKKLVVEYGMICAFLLITLLVMTGMGT
jgi:hypothetical protein